MTMIKCTSHPNDQQMPANIVLDKWADIGFSWQGVAKLSEFGRLFEVVDKSIQQNAGDTLTIKVLLSKKNDVLWLEYQVEGVLWLACQRCLSPLDIDVSGEYILAILKDESEIGRVDGAEFVLVDEICSNDGRKMLPLRDLLEDELLLALPLSARHEDCQMLVDETDEQNVLDNPFAILATLKQNQ